LNACISAWRATSRAIAAMRRPDREDGDVEHFEDGGEHDRGHQLGRKSFDWFGDGGRSCVNV
jgi:hypothetical protein